jgi:exopolysaccharide production protein ExoQ
MKQYVPSRALPEGMPVGRFAPRVVGSPRFNPHRPIGAYARRLPGHRPSRHPWIEFDSDGFFAFVVVAIILFGGAMFGTVSAAAISAMAAIYIAVRLPQLGEILAPRAFILVIPIFAVLSVLWSQSPLYTFKYSLEFALTVGVGLLLSAAPYPRAVLWGVFLAFASYVLAALAFGQTVDLGNNGETAFSGLTQGKNLMGDIAATGSLASLACVVAAIEDRRLLRVLAALTVTMLEMYVLLKARSAGALLGMVPAVLTLIFFLALRPARLIMRLIAAVFMSLAAAFVAVAYGSTVVQDSMTLFDKDPTLTGRTYLWQRAADFIAEKPALGTGFNAFWEQGNPDAEGLWRFGGIVDRMGFSFHNTFIELLVNVGWIGLFVFAIVAIIGSVLLVRRVMMRPSLTLCFWLSLLTYEFVRIPVEAIGTAPYSYGTVLLFAGFGAALPARRTAEARKAARRLSRYRMRLPRAVLQRSALQPTRFST